MRKSVLTLVAGVLGFYYTIYCVNHKRG